MKHINIQSYEHDYNRQLVCYRPVEAVHQSRRIQEELDRDAYDTTFDHFLYDYVGDPLRYDRSPSIKIQHPEYGELNYSNRMYFGFTDMGKLLLVRCSTQVTMDNPAQFFIATADLATQQIAEWRVTDLKGRDSIGFECYMEDEEGNEAHLELGTQKVRLFMAGARRPEAVKPFDSQFIDLLDRRSRFRDAEAIGNLLVFMAFPEIQVTTPATIAA